MNIKSGLNWHVYPLNDLKEHNTDSSYCWCNPKLTHEEDGIFVIVHHAMDGRELKEQHIKPN